VLRDALHDQTGDRERRSGQQYGHHARDAHLGEQHPLPFIGGKHVAERDGHHSDRQGQGGADGQHHRSEGYPERGAAVGRESVHVRGQSASRTSSTICCQDEGAEAARYQAKPSISVIVPFFAASVVPTRPLFSTSSAEVCSSPIALARSRTKRTPGLYWTKNSWLTSSPCEPPSSIGAWVAANPKSVYTWLKREPGP